MNRREAAKCLTLIGAAAALGEWPETTLASSIACPDRWAAPLWHGTVPLHAVIRDGRYDDAVRFAGALAGPRTPHLDARGDAVALWLTECRSRLPVRSWRLAGMTTYCDFTVLRACARERGGRVLYEALHDSRGPGRVLHRVSAGAAAGMLAGALRHDDWVVPLARALARAPLRPTCAGERTVRVEGGRPASDHPGTLASWVIGSD